MNRYPRTYASGHPRSRSRLRATMAEQTSSTPTTATAPCPTLPLAFPYVPTQPWGELYEPEEGWHHGTIFPALDMPYEEGGRIQ